MEAKIRELFDSFSEFVEKVRSNRKNVKEPLFDVKPDFGTISTIEEYETALKQAVYCGKCDDCYWDNNCFAANVSREWARVMQLLFGSHKEKHDEKFGGNHVTCKQCVYATSTNPRICMCKDSIAKHGYVRDDSYCDKGELCEI